MKGQVTIFIILMLLVLFVFGFMFYVLNQSAQQKTQEQIQITVEEIIANTNVDQTIKSCLDESVTEGLKLISRQGGFLYKNQNYTTKRGNEIQVGRDFDLDPSGNTINVSDKNYTILITASELTDSSGINGDYVNLDSPVHFTPPLYPCFSMYKSPFFDSEVQINFSEFGENCMKDYTLDIPIAGFSTNKRLKLCGRNSSEDLGCKCSINCNGSIQNMLEYFVEKTFPECFNNITFPQYDVKLSDFSLYSDFSGRSLDFSIIPNLTISSKDNVFSAELPQVRSRRFAIKLKSIIDTLNKILESEAQIPGFNFSKGFNDVQAGLQLAARIQNPMINYVHNIENNGKYYHLYEVVLDNDDGTLAGQPFKFTFAVENRIPVLQDVRVITFDNKHRTLQVCYVDPDEEFIFGMNPTISGIPSTWTTVKRSCIVDEINCDCYDYTISPTSNGLYNLDIIIKDGVTGKMGANWKKYSDYDTAQIIVN